jgi:hypothetical protein
MDVDIIKTKLNIKYYQGLLYSLSQNDPNYNWIKEYYENLLITIKNDYKLSEDNLLDTAKNDDTQTEKMSDKVSDKLDLTSSIESDNHKQIFSDDSLYKKSWTKLNAIHKILKIKEFVNNLKINSEKERFQLRDDLIELIKLKVLTKKEKVSYDEINGKIISLVDLQYKNGKYYYLND